MSNDRNQQQQPASAAPAAKPKRRIVVQRNPEGLARIKLTLLRRWGDSEPGRHVELPRFIADAMVKGGVAALGWKGIELKAVDAPAPAPAAAPASGAPAPQKPKGK